MREIKFRGKVVHHDPMTNPDDGWVYGFYYQDLDNGEIKHYIISCPMIWKVIPETVSQYTGLRDRNGVDIYEWDIVRSPRYKSPVVVCVIEGCFAVCDPNCCETCRRFETGIENLADAIVFSSKELEVIGKFHDNPELLESPFNK